MKNIIFLIFLLFIFNSCSDELITIVDEYNPPYDIKAIPDENGTTVSISFWSGVLADDFVGFNLYANTSDSFTQPDGAVGYPSLPTVRVETHTRSNFTLPFTGYTFDTTQVSYITVTAYGTNDLAEGSRIETKINTIIPVFPRRQENGTVTPNTSINAGSRLTATINNNTITAAGYQVKSYGYQTNFNAVTVFTNNNTSSSAPYLVGGLYIFSNYTAAAAGNPASASLTKVWITSDSACIYAGHDKAADGCNTI